MSRNLNTNELQFSGKSYLTGEALPTEMSEGILEYHRQHRKFVKATKKNGVNINYVDPDLIKPHIAAQMNSVSDFLEERFPLLPKLYDDMMLAKVKYNLEQRYKEFFDEVSGEGSHDWKLFYSKENEEYVWTERTCGIFGNLATIYRQRGWYAACDEVMVYYTYVIQHFEAMIRARLLARKSDNDELVHCRQLVMKYHRVAANLGANLKRTTNMPVSYRFLIGYEIDMGIANTEADEYAWMMEGFINRKCTKANLAITTDAELTFMAEMLYKLMPHTNEQQQVQEQAVNKEEYERDHPGERYGGSVVLSKCEACKSTEPFLGTYKQCGRCKSVKYCGKDCQVAHHPAHKTLCKQIASGKSSK